MASFFNIRRVHFGETGTQAAAGNSQATATELDGCVRYITGVDGTAGVRLPNARVGALFYVYNMDASNGLPIYPHAGGDINDGTSNAAITIEGKTLATFVKLDATTWAAQFTANA